MKLTAKLGLSIMLIALIPLLAFGGLALRQARESITHQIQDGLRINAERARKQVEILVEMYEERVRLVASRTQLRLSLKAHIEEPDPQHVEKMTKILNNAMDSIPDFESISIAGLDGLILAATAPDRLGADIAKEDYFRSGLESVGISHFFQSENELRTRLTSPLVLDGEPLGVLIIRTAVDDLIDSLAQREGLGKTGETLLARRLPNGDAQFITPLRFDPNAALRRTIPASKAEVPIIQALLKNATQLNSAPDYRGVPVIAITEYLEKTDWGMVSKIDRSEAFAPLERATVSLVSALLLTGGFVFLLALGAANRLTGPIVDLASTARRVESESNYSIRAPLLIAGDEIGELTKSFNNMLEAIGERERAIQENEKQPRAILETAVERIVSIDENGVVLSFNEAASDIFGYDQSEVIGKNVNILMPEPDHDGYLENYLENGERKIIGSGREVQGKRKSGEVFPIDLSISEVELPDRKLFTGFIRDISDRRRSEE